MDGNSLNKIKFIRKFSVNFFKNKKLLLGGMEFSKDVKKTERGDKYPLVFSSGEYTETVEGGTYRFDSENGCAARLIGHFVPYATYSVEIAELNGECGFLFVHGNDRVKIALRTDENGALSVCSDDGKTVKTGKSFVPGMSFLTVARKNFFDVYTDTRGIPEFVCTIDAPAFEHSDGENFFMNTQACLYAGGEAAVKEVSVYMDSGVSQADIRAVRYENGDVIYENGKIFFTASVRLESGGYQGVFSWVPGTAEFELTGALFFDAGDGVWANEVASSLVFDRKTQRWILWVCAFSRGHILGYSVFDGEPRYGRNVIDITLVKPLSENDDDTVFGGKKGDEDPALYYDETEKKWYLAVCRIASGGGYAYHFFESDSPTGDFKFICRGLPGAETGGSFVKHGGKLYFVCGNGFDENSCYRVYEWGDMSRFEKLQADFPDGGFRGWGTLLTVKQGTRERLYHLTFDRTLGSSSGYNWSYGNLYCFEGE